MLYLGKINKYQTLSAGGKELLEKRAGVDSVAVELNPDVHRLESELRDSSRATAKRHYPSTTIGTFPIRCKGGLPTEIPTLAQVVGDEILQQKLVHVGQVGMTRYGPDIIEKRPNRPFARLYQEDSGWPHAEFSLSKDACLCRRR